jgi:CelD/BcsL family acetyltransferase involved in cellulose biosynthesis
MITLEIIEETSRFAELRDEWNELLRSSAADSVFLTWEWLFAWWIHVAQRCSLFIVAVREDGVLIAIAPLTRSLPGRRGTLALPSLRFLGTGVVGSDYLDLIIRPGRERAAMTALAVPLAAERAAIRLANLRVDAPGASALVDALKPEGWAESRRTMEACPFIPLTGHTWASYLSSLGADHRYNFQRRLRNATRAFSVRFELARSEAERRDALERLIALHERRWDSRGGGSEAFETPALRRFHGAISQLALDRGWLRLFVLRFDDQPAAGLYGFQYGGVFSFYQSGFDPRFQKQSVGLLTMGLAIQSAIEEGASEFDLLHGQEAYKFHWAKDVRVLDRLELYPPRPLAMAVRRLEAVARATRRGARRILPGAVIERLETARRSARAQQQWSAR